MKVKNFSYNGLFGRETGGYANYTAEFKSWTEDPSVALCFCSDGTERLIPTCFLEGFKTADYPEQDNGVRFFTSEDRAIANYSASEGGNFVKKSTYVALVLVLTMALCLLSGCGNMQVIDTTFTFDKAIIELPNGEIVSGEVQSWKDYEGDQIQVKVNDKTYLVHSSNVALIAE